MWSASLYHSKLDDHKPAIQINLEHLTYGRVCPVDRMKLHPSAPHESESRVQAASTFGSGFDNFTRETTRTFKISSCLQSLPLLTLRAAPTYETQPFHGCRKRRRCSSGNKSRPGHRHSPGNGFRSQRTNRVRDRSHPLGGVRILVWRRVWSASSNVAMTKTDNTTKDFRFVEHPRSSKYIKVVIVVTVAKSPRH
jgi:hypothetical protein